jgi:hypothetical protein
MIEEMDSIEENGT